MKKSGHDQICKVKQSGHSTFTTCLLCLLCISITEYLHSVYVELYNTSDIGMYPKQSTDWLNLQKLQKSANLCDVILV